MGPGAPLNPIQPLFFSHCVAPLTSKRTHVLFPSEKSNKVLKILVNLRLVVVFVFHHPEFMDPSGRKSLREILDSIRTEFVSLRLQLQEHSNTARDSAKSQASQQEAIASALVRLRVPNDERLKEQCTQERRHRESLAEQRRLRCWTAAASFAAVAAFIAAAVYATIAYCQWRTMNRQLVLTQRPWIKATGGIDGPFRLSRDGGEGHFRIFLTNIGNTPAIHIHSQVEIYLPSPHHLPVVQEEKRFCREVTAQGGGFEVTLFPKDSYLEHQDVQLSKKAIDLTVDDLRSTYSPQDLGNISSLPMDLIYCVAYSSSVEVDERYYTGFVGSVEKKVGNGTLSIFFGDALESSDLVLAGDPTAHPRSRARAAWTPDVVG